MRSAYSLAQLLLDLAAEVSDELSEEEDQPARSGQGDEPAEQRPHLRQPKRHDGEDRQ